MIIYPEYFEKSLCSVETMNINSKLLSDRIIMIFDEINDDVAQMVISQLLFLEAMDKTKEIKILINSDGGMVCSGLAIYDVIKHIKCDVSTICIGRANSMAAVILSAGTKGKRFATKNSTIMIHQVLSGIGVAQATEIQIRAKNILDSKEQLNSILAGETNQPIEKVTQDTERDYFMKPDEALKYGIIDEVI